jgi:hypothetical protein
MPYKNLNLNQSTFDKTLTSYPGLSIIKKDIKEKLTQYTVKVIDKTALLNIHFNNSGTTTINFKVGKEQDLGLRIASYLKKELVATDVKQASFSIRTINDEEYQYLKEYLEDCKITSTLVNNVNGEKIKFTSPFKDTMTVTRYNNGNTLFQGKPLHVFSEIKIFLTEILDLENILNIENQVYKININSTEITEELNAILPNSNSYLCSQTKNMLSSALAMNKIDISLPDYTAFSFPALRALEGYLKLVFNEKGITLGSHGFNQFDKPGLSYVLKPSFVSTINCQITTDGIEKCYNYFYNNRHTLFHTNNVTATTRLLVKKEEATKIVETVFKLIEETHSARLPS